MAHVIYENDATLENFVGRGLQIAPFYWERSPLSPRIPESARGLKLHPYIENYVLTPENVFPALQVARQRRMPVLIHSDDRNPNVSRGHRFLDLARAFPEITFIMAHAGSYAPPQMGTRGQSLIPEALIRELVEEAIAAAESCRNIYLECSILASDLKTRLIAERCPPDRLLLGSDFPIFKGSFGSISFQEKALLDSGMSVDAITRIHSNALDLFKLDERAIEVRIA